MNETKDNYHNAYDGLQAFVEKWTSTKGTDCEANCQMEHTANLSVSLTCLRGIKYYQACQNEHTADYGDGGSLSDNLATMCLHHHQGNRNIQLTK